MRIPRFRLHVQNAVLTGHRCDVILHRTTRCRFEVDLIDRIAVGHSQAAYIPGTCCRAEINPQELGLRPGRKFQLAVIADLLPFGRVSRNRARTFSVSVLGTRIENLDIV